MRGLGIGFGISRPVGSSLVYDINDTIFASDAAWLVTSMTKTATAGPTAIRQVAATAQHNLYKYMDFLAGIPYSFDVRLKRVPGGVQKYTAIYLYGTTPGLMIVDHDTGLMDYQEQIPDAAVTDIGDGILSLTGTYTSAADSLAAAFVLQSLDDTYQVSFLGDIAEGFDLTSVQVSH